MIYGLYRFLRNRFYFLDIRTTYFTIISMGVGFFTFTGRIPMYLGVGAVLGLMAVYSGVLNTPYLYVYHSLSIWINKRITGKRIFIFIDGEKLYFRNYKAGWLSFKEACGLRLEDSAYVDKDYKERDLVALDVLEKFYNVTYFSTEKGNLMDDIKSTDSMDMVKKKIILFNLGRSE
jgi:hypothetical protein